MAPRFSKIMSKMRDEEDVPADIPSFGRENMMMPEPERDIAKPFPPGIAAQEAFDDMLQRRVMDPLYNAGHEDLGAALSAIPSAAHSMIVPQTDLDVAGTIIPLPGVAKLMKKGKFRRIRNAMKAEDPENIAGIIAKQAEKAPKEYINPSFDDDIRNLPDQDKAQKALAEVRAIDEKEVKQRADYWKEKEKQFFDQHGATEKEIEKLIKEKYGIEGDNWSAVDSEADLEFGHSDLSGKQGNLYEITDGETTLQVTEREYLDIMGLSGGIPMEDTPFAQAMKTKKPKVEAPKPRSWTDIRPENTYVLDGRIMSGEELKDELLQMSTGDFHTAKWELYDPRKHMSVDPSKAEKEKWSKILREDEELDAEKNQQAIDEALKTIQDRKNKPKLVDPPKSPKGDPEASSRFPGIQSQMDVAPSRMDERGRSFDNVGQSDFTPYDRPMPRFEDVPRRNYVESEMGPTVDDMSSPLKPRQIRRMMYDTEYKPNELDDLANYTKAQKRLKGMYEEPFIYDEDAEILQEQMYKGRPSFEAEQSKLFPKVNEAVKETTVPKKGHKGGANEHIPSGSRNTQGKYIVKDWAGNEKDYFGSYDSSEEAYDEIAEWLRSKGIDDADLDLELDEYNVVPRKK